MAEPTIMAGVAAVIGSLLTFLGLRLQRSGTTRTSESGELWEESKAMRLELRAEITTLRAELATKNAELLRAEQARMQLEREAKIALAHISEPREFARARRSDEEGAV